MLKGKHQPCRMVHIGGCFRKLMVSSSCDVQDEGQTNVDASGVDCTGLWPLSTPQCSGVLPCLFVALCTAPAADLPVARAQMSIRARIVDRERYGTFTVALRLCGRPMGGCR